MMKLLVALLLVSGLDWVHSTNVNIEEGGVVVKVLGQSGKILIRQKDKEFNTTDEIVVEMDTLTEVASDGTAAGKDNKHKVNSFASQNFTFTGTKDGKYKDTDLDVKQFTFTSKIDNATLKVFLYIFKKEGDVLNGDEVTQVKNGTVKFNIELKDWQFCEGKSSDCNNNGIAVDFALVIKGKSKPVKKARAKSSKNADKKQAENYNLGNADIQLSSKVNVDGNVTSMASGFPKVTKKNKKQTFTFRFPKFNNTVMYDPAIDLMISDANGQNGVKRGWQIANMPNLFLVVLSLAFARFLA